jgi:cytosine/adenosine deaminase-related metal-dependent hydrolase
MKITATRVFDGYRFLPEGTVIIADGEGTITDILPREEAGEDVRVMDGILSPGFVNCHCHLELSHLKGQIPERTGLAEFVAAVMKQRQMPVEIMTEAIAQRDSGCRRHL